MRRSLWSRILTAVVGLWLVLELGDPGMLHLAAMSVGAPMTHGMAGMTHDMAGMSHDMAGMSHDMGPSAKGNHGDHDAPNGGAPEQTTCPCVAGGCVTATAIALVDAAPRITFADALAMTPAAERVTVSLLPRPGPRYSRPYTTGPPRA